MRTPSDRDESICAMFDSFCVTVIRNCSRNLKRAAENRKKYDATGDEAVEYLIELLTHEDVYEAEQLVFYADGCPCVVENELLYQAIQSLPENQRMVLLYDFWLDLTDKEIAVRMEVTVRTVYNLRQRAFNKIRTYYELHGRGCDP